jgi:hypothetical protein
MGGVFFIMFYLFYSISKSFLSLESVDTDNDPCKVLYDDDEMIMLLMEYENTGLIYEWETDFPKRCTVGYDMDNPCIRYEYDRYDGFCRGYAQSGQCDDGNPCTLCDVCINGICEGFITGPCNDGVLL